MDIEQFKVRLFALAGLVVFLLIVLTAVLIMILHTILIACLVTGSTTIVASLLIALYAGVNYHKTRKLDLLLQVQQLEKVKTETWAIEQNTLTSKELADREHERELKRIELEYQFKFHVEQMKYQYQVLGANQSYVIRQDDGSIVHVQGPQVAQIARGNEKAKADEIDTRPIPSPIDVATLLQSGQWLPSEQSLLLAVGPDGPVSVDYSLAWHIALAGATGGGKTNELRLILAQMVKYSTVYYISPAFAPIKANKEDWRQIQARLAGPVARKADEIEYRFQWAVKELKRRQDAEFAGDYSWKGQKVYLVIDEYKEVIARYPDAPVDVSTLLRQARQYDIFVVVAAQDFLIKSIGGDSGARDCYRTALYFGGDPYTCKALLDVSGTLPFEEDLGKAGHMVLRTKSTKVSQARAPFMSNRAVYMLLEWPADPILDDAPVGNIPLQGDSSNYRGDRGIKHHDEQWRDIHKSPTMVVDAPEYQHQERFTGPLDTPSKSTLNALENTVPMPFEYSPIQGPDLGPNDKAFTDEQESEFIKRMRKQPTLSIKDCLRQMNNGEGLSNRYHKHASYLVELYGLKKEEK